MSMSRFRFWLSIGVAMAVGCIVAQKVEFSSSSAEEKISPVKPRARDFYVPNSEALGADEMRIVACGTGMPTARPSQANASSNSSTWLSPSSLTPFLPQAPSGPGKTETRSRFDVDVL